MFWNNESTLFLNITKLLDERDSRLNTNLQRYMEKEDTKLDKIIDGFAILKTELNTLNQTVSKNHSSALVSINDKKHEIKEEVSKNYATKTELNEGLVSIRRTAKIIWTVVLSCSGVALWLSNQGVI